MDPTAEFRRDVGISTACPDGRQSVYNFVGPQKWRGSNFEGPNSKARRAESSEILGEGMFPSSSSMGSAGRCKLPQWGQG